MTSLNNGKTTKNQSGFSLIEVLIAITVFSVFISAYTLTQGNNLTDSIRMSEELILKKLTEKIINEIVLNPEEVTPSQSLKPVTKKFEEDGLEFYEYTIEYQRIELPDLSQIAAGEDNNEDDGGNAALQKRIYDQFKDNIERLVWQARVTVKNTDSGYSYVLSTFIKSRRANVKITL